ncbi:MAG: alanine dehydrogenase [Chitinophagales bacterium]|nr:alanine dehydrogenase [Chitinophagales bacterium]
MNIGIIHEGKVPQDRRVPLTPIQCKLIQEQYPGLKIIVQPSPHRCYTNREYETFGIELNENLEECQALLGVKEVPVNDLISNKTYFMFSHTIKKQSYNRDLLRAIMNKNIRLIDWECLKDQKDQRVIAFGRWAGIVGAYNGLKTWGDRTSAYQLPPMHQMKDFDESKNVLKKTKFEKFKVVLTGDGRVGNGARETLDLASIKRLSSSEFLEYNGDEAVYAQLGVADMYSLPGSNNFDQEHYFRNPEEYESIFEPYTKQSDLMINGIYWDKRVPKFFSSEDMKSPDFRIKAIADITCDIAPDASIPSTLRASEINDPVYGYDVNEKIETKAFQEGAIDVMAVDNLPNELPRDASADFGKQFIQYVLPELLKDEKSEMIHEATICKNGKLNDPFEYLWDYVHESV